MGVINSLLFEKHGDAASTAPMGDAVPVKRRRSKQKPLVGVYAAAHRQSHTHRFV